MSQTNITTGEVRGCLTPNGGVATLYHAKPVLIQGAWLVAKYQNNYQQFRVYKDKMAALLQYWTSTRLQQSSGLYVWFDQMETGADNLVTSQCPSFWSGCWNTKDDR